MRRFRLFLVTMESWILCKPSPSRMASPCSSGGYVAASITPVDLGGFFGADTLVCIKSVGKITSDTNMLRTPHCPGSQF